MNCKNCDTFNSSGKYCFNCGQKLHINLTPNLKDALHDGIHEFFHLDGKIFQTLKYLFFSPGYLTIEFLRGRRVKYINPIRVYLTLSVLYLIAISTPFLSSKSGVFRINLTVDSEKSETVKSDEKTENKSEIYFFGYNADEHFRSIKPIFDRGVDRMEKDNGKEFKKIFSSTMGKALFLLLPVFAFFLYLSYWKRKDRSYLPYLYFSIHYHAALFGGLLLSQFLESFLSSYAMLLWLIWAVAYLFLALKRVWPATKLVTTLRTVSVLLSYCIVFIVVFTSIAIYSAYSLGVNAL